MSEMFCMLCSVLTKSASFFSTEPVMKIIFRAFNTSSAG